MRFLIDANLPPALVGWLIQANHEAVHVGPILGANALDISIWREASTSRSTIITKDADFIQLALADDAGPSVVLVRCGNLGLRPFNAWFVARMPQMFEVLASGERIVELA